MDVPMFACMKSVCIYKICTCVCVCVCVHITYIYIYIHTEGPNIYYPSGIRSHQAILIMVSGT